MELTEIFNDQYTVSAYTKNGECETLDELQKMHNSYKGSVVGVFKLFEQISKTGFVNISSKQIHEVDKNNKIYEFIKGKVRVFFFHGKNNNIVICTSAILKKTNKVDKSEVIKAIKIKQDYESAVINNTLTYT